MRMSRSAWLLSNGTFKSYIKANTSPLWAFKRSSRFLGGLCLTRPRFLGCSSAPTRGGLAFSPSAIEVITIYGILCFPCKEAPPMAHLQFTDVQDRPTEFLDVTSVTLDEFQQLIPRFAVAFQARMAAWRLDGKPRTARQFSVYKNCPLPTPEDRLFFLLTYLK